MYSNFCSKSYDESFGHKANGSWNENPHNSIITEDKVFTFKFDLNPFYPTTAFSLAIIFLIATLVLPNITNNDVDDSHIKINDNTSTANESINYDDIEIKEENTNPIVNFFNNIVDTLFGDNESTNNSDSGNDSSSGSGSSSEETVVNEFTVTVEVNSEEMGEVTGVGTYEENSVVTLTATPAVGYHFVSWNNGDENNTKEITVIEDVIYTATFAINTYTITWKNDLGEVIDTDILEYGETPSHDDPVKGEVGQYVFKGWEPAIESVTEDAEYVAQFEDAVYKLTIQVLPFKYDGEVREIVLDDIPYNTTYYFNKNDSSLRKGSKKGDLVLSLVQDSDEQYAYNLYSLTPRSNDSQHSITSTTITSDKTLYAFVLRELQKYTITWKNDLGEVIGTETLEYGKTPSHTDLTKESTAEFTYTFKGWEPEIHEVTGPETYTAKFDSVINSYTLSVGLNSNEYGTVSVEYNGNKKGCGNYTLDYGASVKLTATPKEGCRFVRWEETNEDNSTLDFIVNDDMSYTAVFEKTYTVIWKNYDGTILEVDENVEYNSYPEYNGETPVRPDYQGIKYEFIPWDVSRVTNDVVYTAQYKEIPQYYTINVSVDDSCDGMGSVLPIEKELYSYGETVTIAAEANTAQHYHFVEWDDGNTDNPRTITVTEGREYIAKFEIDTVNITLFAYGKAEGCYFENGESSYTIAVPYGEKIFFVPRKSRETWTWCGVTDESGEKKYAEVFLVDSDEQYKYSFKPGTTGGWCRFTTVFGKSNQTSYTAIEDASFAIQIISELRQYSVSGSVDLNEGNVTGYGTYDYGKEVTLEAIPNDGYHFVEWKEDGNTDISRTIEIRGDVTYTAVFEKDLDNEMPNSSLSLTRNNIDDTDSSNGGFNNIIKYLNHDGSLLKQYEVALEEATPEYDGPTPEKQEDDNYTYEFIGFTTEDGLTYIAEFNAIPKAFDAEEEIEKDSEEQAVGEEENNEEVVENPQTESTQEETPVSEDVPVAEEEASQE